MSLLYETRILKPLELQYLHLYIYNRIHWDRIVLRKIAKNIFIEPDQIELKKIPIMTSYHLLNRTHYIKDIL